MARGDRAAWIRRAGIAERIAIPILLSEIPRRCPDGRRGLVVGVGDDYIG